jgi:hypothetical protein
MMPPDLRATSLRMRPLAVLLATCTGLCGSALLIAAAYAGDPARPYLGMTREEIVACAGEPYGALKKGADVETLTYHYTGEGPVPAPPGEKKKKDKPGFFGDKGDKDKKKDRGWTCTASLTFEGGRLVRVSFAHKDARSPYAWQSEKNPKKAEAMRKEGSPTCSFSLPNCHR